MTLPQEVEWNIIKFMSHPCADIVKKAREDMEAEEYSMACFGCHEQKRLCYKFFRHCLNTLWYCEDCYSKMPQSLKDRPYCGLCEYCFFRS